jgi:tetratricopeptide (TPR) repeat protein
VLRQGAEGQDVRELQSALNHVDEVKAPLAVDGIFGPLTDKAVREFQANHPPLVADGAVGPKTRAVIEEARGEVQDENQLSRKIFERGATAFAKGNFGVAFDFFAKSHELTPKPSILFNEAQSLRRLGGRRDEAIALFEQFLAEDPGSARAAEATAAVAELRGPGKTGEEDVDRSNAKALFDQGAALFAAGKFALAFDAFTKSDVALHKASLVFNRAQSLRRLGGRRDEAIALFEQYLAEAPAGDRAADATEAVAELKGPGQTGDTEADKANARALFLKGNALFSAGKFALAFDAFSQSDEAFHVASLTFNRAQCLRRLGGRRDEAIALYEDFLAEDPTNSRAREAQFFRDELQSQGAAP